jgi:hypothetical protein
VVDEYQGQWETRNCTEQTSDICVHPKGVHHIIIQHYFSIFSCLTLPSLFIDTFHVHLSFSVHTSILLRFLQHNLPFSQCSQQHAKRIWLLFTLSHNSTWMCLCGMCKHNCTLATPSGINLDISNGHRKYVAQGTKIKIQNRKHRKMWKALNLQRNWHLIPE